MEAAPTQHEPGTPEKVALMATRYEHGVALFLPGDRVRNDELLPQTSNSVEDDEVE